MSDELDEILGETAPSIGQKLNKLDDQHFVQVVQAVNEEYAKRVPEKLGNMNDAEFLDYCRRQGL